MGRIKSWRRKDKKGRRGFTVEWVGRLQLLDAKGVKSGKVEDQGEALLDSDQWVLTA